MHLYDMYNMQWYLLIKTGIILFQIVLTSEEICGIINAYQFDRINQLSGITEVII